MGNKNETAYNWKSKSEIPEEFANNINTIIIEPSIEINTNENAQNNLKKKGFYCSRNGEFLSCKNNKKYGTQEGNKFIKTEKHSNQLKTLFSEYINHIFIQYCHLQSIQINSQIFQLSNLDDKDNNEQKQNTTEHIQLQIGNSLIFVSPNLINYKLSNKTVLIIIPGNGVVRAGLWSTKMYRYDNIFVGTAIPFIIESQKRNWNVLMMDPNESKGKSIYDKNHCLYVFYKYIINNLEQISNIFIVAHSGGASRTSHILNTFCNNDLLLLKLKGIAFTDGANIQSANDKIGEIYEKIAIDFKVDWKVQNNNALKPKWKEAKTGTDRHEYTTPFAFKHIFHFFDEMMKK
eukprot:240549_1